MTDPDTTTDLDAAISALQQDLATIPADEAFAIIDHWQQQLQGDLAEDLGELKSALIGGTSSKGVPLSDILTDLGEDTAEAAANANSDVTVKIQQLAELLSRAGRSLK